MAKVMNLLENYNTAKQKYGDKIVSAMSNNGIPPQYLLSACRFYQCHQIPIDKLQQLFKQWMTYVVKNGSSIDVNRLTFKQFYQTIQKFKFDYGIPNKVYNDGTVSIGKITSAKDMSRFPVTNDWCIKQPNMFQKYKDAGYTFYIIDNRDESDYVRYVILMVGKDGRKYYYDLDNEQMTQDSVLDYQSHLTPQSISFIQSLTENKQHNTNMNKNKIRLTESQLHNMIRESVKRVLNEIHTDTAIAAHKKAQNELENSDMDFDTLYKRERQTDKFLDYAQKKGADYYPYGFIGLYHEQETGHNLLEIDFADSINEINPACKHIYALTRIGREYYDWWEDEYLDDDSDTSKIFGHDAVDLWGYLTSDEKLAIKIK